MNAQPSQGRTDRRRQAEEALDQLRAALLEAGATLEYLFESGRQIRRELFAEHYPRLAKSLGPEPPYVDYDFGDGQVYRIGYLKASSR